MAATYSSFMTTRFYSPVFNTALFDGSVRFYFSQSYENTALKIYQLLQSEYSETWDKLKTFSTFNKEHIFLMIYPEQKDLELVFTQKNSKPVFFEDWEEGLAVGFTNSNNEAEMNTQLSLIVAEINNWITSQKTYDVEQ